MREWQNVYPHSENDDFVCWRRSDIPLPFESIWKTDDRGTTCHHPLLCEISDKKNKGRGTTHTCCRPSHLEPRNKAFNFMNTGLQYQFRVNDIEEKSNLSKRKEVAKKFFRVVKN